MKYNKMLKKDLIKRIELLENMEIGIELLPECEIIVIHPDRKIKDMICLLSNSDFRNKEQIMFTVKTGFMH